MKTLNKPLRQEAPPMRGNVSWIFITTLCEYKIDDFYTLIIKIYHEIIDNTIDERKPLPKR